MLAASTAVLLSNPISAACPDGKLPYEEAKSQKGITFTGPFQVDALERENLIKILEDGKVLPFGYSYDKWLELKAMSKPGDQIFFMEKRDGHFHMDGHVLVSDGCIVYFLPGSIT